ncbi:HNH endonuclease [Haloprofundus sp. MHR1]|uniref:HNH endonuclease n=1 Tax=Haloprofundus sp. MHR1 TaxID=2572921 RepID=UPI0010BED930|nr:HNH endonuclease [Haloprofundus sp. MHR1]QCJ48165.1 HNH endonuclease [Haloprofundus sp. MHR1]
MSRWRRVVRRELRRYRDQTGTDVVSRQDLLDQSLPVLRAEFPDAATPGQTLSRVMQELRDRGEVDFLTPGVYRVADLGRAAEETASTPEPSDGVDAEFPAYEARTYRTTVGARSMPAAFREAILERYAERCPVSGVDRPALLDVAHVLPWSDYESVRTDPENTLLLSKTHHAAFDAGLFTLNGDYRLHVAPNFTSESDVLRRTLVDRDGERVDVPESAGLSAAHLTEHNETLDWW